MSDPKDRTPHDDASQPWNEVSTAPMGRPPPMPAPPAAPASPDSSSRVAAQGDGTPRLAEVKRSPSVERMLDRLGYARPDIPLDTPETDGDIAAAHAAGPHAVPAPVLTPAPQPPIELSHSLVEEISAPISPKGPSAGIAPPMRAGRYAQTVMVRPKVKATHAGILGLAVGACMFLAAVAWKVYERVVAPGSTAATVVVAPVAPEGTAPLGSARPAGPSTSVTSTASSTSTATASPSPSPAPSTLPTSPAMNATSSSTPRAASSASAPAAKSDSRAPRSAPTAKPPRVLRTDFDPNN